MGDINMKVNSNAHYSCQYISVEEAKDSMASIPWGAMPSLVLVDNVTGEPSLEQTTVRGCWSEQFLCFQYICQDSFVRSDYTKRDEPLYEQDVIEIFIDEEGNGIHYIELEISPHNVIFDAKIINNGQGKVTDIDLAWDIEGLRTEIHRPQSEIYIYYIYIPATNFAAPLEKGKTMKVNFYRIDEQRSGEREYQAWRPTGAINFHLAQYFGEMILE